MILIIAAISLLPFLVIMICITYHQIRTLRGLYISRKYDHISNVDFETIPLLPIRVNINLPNSEHGLLIFDVTNIYIEQSQKMYTGTTIGGINIPFSTLGYTKRKFYQRKNYIKYNETNIVLTNMHVWINAYDDPLKIKFDIFNIESLSLCDYGKTVKIKHEEAASHKIKFKSVEEALYFINSIWTIKFNTHSFYKALRSQSKYLETYAPKAITKWDIKRLKQEYKKYPELKDKTWSEIKADKVVKKTYEKNTSVHDSYIDDHRGQKFVVSKNGKNHFFFKKKHSTDFEIKHTTTKGGSNNEDRKTMD